jgi:ClpP class serine protease
LKKVGVERRVYTAGDNKVMLDPFQPEKERDIAFLKNLQLDIHDTFIQMVKARRGQLLADDPDIFSGLFWTGRRGLELGVIDGLGDLRGEVKKRYGDKAQLLLIQPARSLFGRRQTGTAVAGAIAAPLAASAAAGLAEAIEERALWARFGL